MILIVGAGLAGLSAAYHLRGLRYKLLERERRVGGLCRSYVKRRLHVRLHRPSAPFSPDGDQGIGGKPAPRPAAATCPQVVRVLT